MKSFFKHIITSLLALASAGVIRRYNPRVIMVTGSVGKTSTKDAIATTLQNHFFVRKSPKSFNSEFGVPFTILGVDNPWGNPLKWYSVIKATFSLLFLPNHYPNMLVLEVGADRPGDLAKILKIATPDAVVVTRLPDIPVHVEAYSTPQAVRDEEFSPAYALAPGSALVICGDDTHAMEMAVRVSAQTFTFGEGKDDDVRLENVHMYQEDGEVAGMAATVHSGEEESLLKLHGCIGNSQMLAVSAAIATARSFGVTLEKSVAGLASYSPPPGRGILLHGRNGSRIIDDSYNASPDAVEIALANLKAFPSSGRKVAVLGDMLELGRYSVEEHTRVGTQAANSADIVIGIGIRSRRMVEAAKEAGKRQEEVFFFEDSYSAGVALAGWVEHGDVILIKGSQSLRMERAVEALLADLEDLNKLVRQESQWKRIA